LPTREVLALALAHAQARDAVHGAFDRQRLLEALAGIPLEAIAVASRATERTLYLRRPDLGRRLSDADERRLEALSAAPMDLAIIIGDGLSAAAVNHHALPLLLAFLPHARRHAWSLAPVAIAEGTRVALGDEIASRLGARLAVMLIGERPGLSSPDSLGVYITFDPKSGRTDAERNCISNVRAGGLEPRRAADKLAWLVEAALSRRLTGVDLKDESDAVLPSATEAAALTRS
jgi:ethanolamine ammonia-lyase small subunit